jgi:hypothetical protein
MNEFTGPERTVDPQLLDRLVDGELAGPERRELLTTLERRAGWRQCALAFLEAQSWREALTGYDGDPAEAAATSPSPLMGEGRPAVSSPLRLRPEGSLPNRDEGLQSSAAASALAASNAPPVIADAPSPPAHNHGHFTHWKSWVGMAASFLITLSLGMYIQHLWHPGAGVTSSQPGIEAGTVQSVRPGVALSDNLVLPMQAQQGQGLEAWSPVMPDVVRESLVQSDFRVQQERVYVPIQLPNGQQISVPIDRVNIVPVGGSK